MRHGTVSINQIAAVLDCLGGKRAVTAMLADRPFPLAKYGTTTLGQVEAGINALGGEWVLEGLISGALTARCVGDELLIEPAKRPLFDRHGRRIPPSGLRAPVRDADPAYRLYQPDINKFHQAGLGRLELAGLSTVITPSDFLRTGVELITQLRNSGQAENLLRGVHLPIVIPQLIFDDLGQNAEQFVQAAAASYLRQFPGRQFVNHRRGELAGRVKIVASSRYEQLVEKITEGPVVGIYFPNPLQGFSVEAQLEQTATLPQGFVLSGVIDTAVGWIMYPDVLGRDMRAPSCDCSANQREYAPMYFGVGDNHACFDDKSPPLNSQEVPAYGGHYSGGLLYIGQ